MTSQLPRLTQTVLDTPDPRALAEFYRELLGLVYPPGLDPEENDWINLRTPDGEPALAFQRVEEHTPPTWPDGAVPQQLHLDLGVPSVEELDAQHERAIALGARLLSDQKEGGPDEPFRAYADPHGHPFCLFLSERMAAETGDEPVTGVETDVSWEDARAANRDIWDDRAVLHEDLYDAHGLAADHARISEVVRHDLPVLLQHLPGRSAEDERPLAGLDLVHLQCHIGTDTLSLARLGATVTGVDFSPSALEVARRLAAEAGQEITWVESDVLAAREAVAGDFDVVYTSIGTIIWLSDLTTWARQVAGLLRPGGVFYIRDGHPMMLALDETAQAPEVRYRYFPDGRAQLWDDGGTYAGEGTTEHTRSYEWPHPLSEIVTALLREGLVLERFDEGRTLPWKFTPDMTRVSGSEDSYEFGPELRDRIPCTYTLVARRPLAGDEGRDYSPDPGAGPR